MDLNNAHKTQDGDKFVTFNKASPMTITYPKKRRVGSHKDCKYEHGKKKSLLPGESVTLCPKVFNLQAPLDITNRSKDVIYIT